ncbi:hypothetical protein LguiB_023131 [Lonicera macranthoides]
MIALSSSSTSKGDLGLPCANRSKVDTGDTIIISPPNSLCLGEPNLLDPTWLLSLIISSFLALFLRS